MADDAKPMDVALELAQMAADTGEVPVGAVIVRDGQIIAAAANAMRQGSDPTAHAELVAIRTALERVEGGRLDDCDLYVTLEPCTMCAGAIAHAKIRRLYYGAEDPKGGAVDNGVRFFNQPTCHHSPEIIGGVQASRSAEMLRKFFFERR